MKAKTVDEYLAEVDYSSMEHYVPSEFSLAFINFIKLVNGPEGEENKTPVVHYHMLDNVAKPGNLINLCHRGFAKTTVIGEYMIPYIACFHELPAFGEIKYILYVTDSMDNGVKSMRKNLEFRYNHSAFLKAYLPVVKFTENSWEFTDKDGKQLVVDAFGAKTGIRGTKKLGTRPQLLLIDDVLSDEDARSSLVLHSIEDTLNKAVKYAMHPRNKVIWCGTPFSKKDPLYKAVESGVYNVNVYPICERFPCTKEEFKGSWEDRFPYEYVKKAYDEAVALGATSSFNQELMLRIISEEDQLVATADIMWYKRNTLLPRRDNYNFYITTDFATSTKDSADYSVISVWAYSSNGDFFWVDGIVKRQNMNKNYEDLFMLVQTYRPILVGIEITGQQGGFVSTIVDMMVQRNIFFNLAKTGNTVGIRPTKDKLTRFNVVLPWFKLNKVYFPVEYKEDPRIVEFIGELSLITSTGFKSKHDDCIDTVSMLGDMYNQMYKPEFNTENMLPNYADNCFEIDNNSGYNEVSPLNSYIV